MMGSAVAYFLTANPDFDGTVLVVEPDWTYDRAQTTRAQNSIREQFTNPLNIELSRFGIDFINDFHTNVEVVGESPEISFRSTGYLFLADDDDAVGRLADEAEQQRAHDVDVMMLTPGEVAERFSYMDPDQIAGARLGGMREGSFDGWGLFQGIRRRAISQGATYVHDTVVGIDRVGSRVRSVTLASGDTVECSYVINTAGCRAPEIAALVGLDLPVEPRARTSFVFDCRTPIAENVPLTVTPHGVHFRREQHHYMCGTVPTIDVAVSPDDLRPRDEEFEELIWPVLARYVPCFDQVQVVTSWGGQYDFNTLDHNLIIGAGSEVENFLFANGLSGHGLQQGPAIGRGLSELIVYGEYRTLDLRPLGYERIERNEPILEHAVI